MLIFPKLLTNTYPVLPIIPVTGVPATFWDWGLGVGAKNVYFPTENPDDYPTFIKESSNGDIAKMKFNLLLVSMIHARHGKVSDSALKDPINDTAYSVLMYCLVRAIDKNPGYNGNSAEEDWNIMKNYGYWNNEIQSAFAPNKNGDMTVWNELNSDSMKAYFTECWEISKFLSNFTFTAESATLNFVEAVDASTASIP